MHALVPGMIKIREEKEQFIYMFFLQATIAHTYGFI